MDLIAHLVTFIVLTRTAKGEMLQAPQDLVSDMIGDVNLFLSDAPEEEEAEKNEYKPSYQMERTHHAKGGPRKQGELEIMIAEQTGRRKGYASQAISLMMCYAMQHLNLGPEDFIVRIGKANGNSIELFQKLGFNITKEVEIFQEVEMRICTRPSHFRWLMQADSFKGKSIELRV